MTKEMNVAEWMESVDLPYIIDAEKYLVGQNLTEDDAWKIKGYVEYSILCREGLEAGFGLIFTLPGLYMDQIDMLINLIWYPGVDPESNWSDALLGTLDETELNMLHDIMSDVLTKNEEDFPEMSVANWMNVRDLPYLEDAECYTIGQNLTANDAATLRIYASYVLAVCLECEELYEHPESDPELHCDFVKLLLELIWTINIPDSSNWRSELWNTLTPKDLQMCHHIMRDLLAG